MRLRCGDGQDAGPEVTGGDALLEPIGVGGFEERGIGRSMDAPGPRRRKRCALPRGSRAPGVDGLGCETVVHDRAPRAIHRDAIARGGVIAGQDQDHLEPWERRA